MAETSEHIMAHLPCAARFVSADKPVVYAVHYLYGEQSHVV